MQLKRRVMRLLGSIPVGVVLLVIVMSALGSAISGSVASDGNAAWVRDLATPLAFVAFLGAGLLFIGFICGRLGYLDEG